MTIGIMGSGKSTWARSFAKENPEFMYFSTDTIRAEIGVGEHDQTVNLQVYKLMERKTENAFRNGRSVLLDATFIKKSWRIPFIEIAKRHGAKTIAHVFVADRETLLKRIEKRSKEGGLFVPTHAVDRYISKFSPPTASEFDEIINH